MAEQTPLPRASALRAVARCVVSTVLLLAQRRIHLPTYHVGMRLRFANGTSSRVYRETTLDRGETKDSCVLVVEFRLLSTTGESWSAGDGRILDGQWVTSSCATVLSGRSLSR
jgi:hypothetical protein